MKKQLWVASLAVLGQFACGDVPSNGTVFRDLPLEQELGKTTQAYSGFYYVQNINSGKCLDLSGSPGIALRANAQLFDCEPDVPSTDQMWAFDSEGFLSNVASDRCLDVQGSPGRDNGDNVMLWDCERSNPNTDQRWLLEDSGFLVNQASGKCLDLQGSPGTANRANAQLWECEYDYPMTDQRWRLVRTHQLRKRGFDLDDGLVGHWSLSNSYSNSGTALADTRRVSTAPTSYAPGPFKEAEGSLQFDGSSYLAVDFDHDLAPSRALTFGARIYRDDWSESVSGSQSLVSKKEGGGYALYQWGNDTRVSIHLAQTNSYVILSHDTSGYQGWNQISATFNGSEFAMWINGKQVEHRVLSDSNYTIDYRVRNELIIGSEAGSGAGASSSVAKFTGRIADVRVYDRPLSAGELTVLGAGVASWDLEEFEVYDGLRRTSRDVVGLNYWPRTTNNPSTLTRIARLFNQDRDHVNIPFEESLAPSEITVATWAYRADWGVDSVTSYDSLVSKTQGGGYSIDHSGQWIRAQVRRQSASDLTEMINANSLTPGWHHFSFTYNSHKLKFYVDGTLEKTSESQQTGPIHYDYDNSLIIGGDANSGSGHATGHYFRGSIGSVQVFDRALPGNSIVDVMNLDEQIQFVGDERVYNRYSVSRALAAQGMTLVASKKIRENECTLGYADSDGQEGSVKFGAMVCATKLNGRTTLTSKAVVGKCQDSGVGGQCEVGLSQNEIEVEIAGGASANFTVNGPSAEACGSLTAEAMCANLGANLAETSVSLTDKHGNSAGIGVSVGVGVGLNPSFEDGILTVGVDLAIGVGISIELSVNVDSLIDSTQDVIDGAFYKTADGVVTAITEGASTITVVREGFNDLSRTIINIVTFNWW